MERGDSLTDGTLSRLNGDDRWPDILQGRLQRRFGNLIRLSAAFDAVVDFARIIGDPDTGALRAQYVHNTTVGGEGDKLHPNRLGYLAMGLAVELESLIAPETSPHPQPGSK